MQSSRVLDKLANETSKMRKIQKYFTKTISPEQFHQNNFTKTISEVFHQNNLYDEFYYFKP